MTFSIKEFISKNNTIIFVDEANDWKHAIKISLEPLFNLNICTNEYYDSIIKSTEKFGPYYILCPKVAMPHGEIGKGVNENGISIAIFKKPIYFNNSNEPINILVPLCAKDALIHTSVALPQIAALFEDEKNIKEILNKNSIKDLIIFINGLDLNKYLV